MNEVRTEGLGQYYADAASWAVDRQRADERSRNVAWRVAAIAGAIALVEAFALFALIPLKREVPYTLLVDRQTGGVEALRPLDESHIAADAALTRSFLVQYVVARESFDTSTLQENYRKVGLMSAGQARERYLAQMQSNAPDSPLHLPRSSTIDVRIRSVSSIGRNSALVRFDTVQTDRGAQEQVAQNWAAVIQYRYDNARMSAADRLVNPLGFQVIRYRKDPESLPDASELPAPTPRSLNPPSRARVGVQ